MEECLEVDWESSGGAVGLWFSREGGDWRIASELTRSKTSFWPWPGESGIYSWQFLGQRAVHEDHGFACKCAQGVDGKI